jgi:hypothetical protein
MLRKMTRLRSLTAYSSRVHFNIIKIFTVYVSETVPLVQIFLITESSWKNKLQSQSYVTTDGQSVSLSWCQAPIWGATPDFYYGQTVTGLLM